MKSQSSRCSEGGDRDAMPRSHPDASSPLRPDVVVHHQVKKNDLRQDSPRSCLSRVARPRT